MEWKSPCSQSEMSLGAPDLRVCFPKKRISRSSESSVLDAMLEGTSGDYLIKIRRYNEDTISVCGIEHFVLYLKRD
ncbi:hypothetical protein CEXT_436801 [Caerostris extrusa]|uniref:Uncharacterized protein n=1 Tax=Caerostris extrusa TaxID=172846 RepID=A0AAV4TBE7_CAEEX|nr:hypothetical protein CEXT_436801 [Caerostris extrusa]